MGPWWANWEPVVSKSEKIGTDGGWGHTTSCATAAETRDLKQENRRSTKAIMDSDPAAGRGTGEHPEAASNKTMSSEAGATNTAAASGIEPAASLEDKLKPKCKPISERLKGKLDTKVVEVKIEKVTEDHIQHLRTRPMRRPTPIADKKILKMCPDDLELRERILVTDAHVNKVVDMQEDILRQYDTKGYAMVGVEYLDNGMKRLFQIPEEDAA
ncbi:unnamed protein product [Urochloa humidicola]